MSVSVNLCPVPKLQFSQNGMPLVGGKLFTYEAGTSTKLATYADSGGVTTNNNPIILDSNGQCDCFLQGGLAYKLVLAPATDTDPPTNPYWAEDNVTGINQVLSTFGQDIGTANNYIVNLVPAITSYADGQLVVFDAANTNTGASTLNVDGLGPKQILVAGAATIAGAIVAGQRYLMSYSAVLGAFVQLGSSSSVLVGSTLNIAGAAAIGGNISIAGTATIGAVSAGAAAIGGNISIAGTATIGAVSAGAAGSAQPAQIQNVLGAGFGAYTDQTANRAVGVVYTNTTPRPLVVVIMLSMPANSYGTLLNSPETIFYDQIINFSTGAVNMNIKAIIPPGATYFVQSTGVSILHWYEY